MIMRRISERDIAFIKYLHNEEGKKTKEISEITGVSKTSIRVIIHDRRDEVNRKERERYWRNKKVQSEQAAKEQTTPPEEQTEPEIMPGFNRVRYYLILMELLDCFPDDLLSVLAEAFDSYKKRLQSSD